MSDEHEKVDSRAIAAAFAVAESARLYADGDYDGCVREAMIAQALMDEIESDAMIWIDAKTE